MHSLCRHAGELKRYAFYGPLSVRILANLAAAWSSNAALLPPPDPLVALCQGPGQEVICEAGGEVPNFLGFYLAPAAGPANAAMAIKFL
jgi:hypothetical protein